MGLLWLSRFLHLWCDLWPEPRPPTFKRALDASYSKHVEPYHSWLLQRTMFLATNVVPEWEGGGAMGGAGVRELLGALDAYGEDGVVRTVRAMEPCVMRIQKQLKARGLWDERKI